MLLKNIQNRAIVRYRFLLQVLEQAQISLKAEWGSPFKDMRRANPSLAQIRNAINILNLEGEITVQNIEITRVLQLIGVSTNQRKIRSSFEFISFDAERYRGVLSESLLQRVAEGGFFTVPAYNVIAEIEESIEINPATNEEKVSYTLLDIRENE